MSRSEQPTTFPERRQAMFKKELEFNQNVLELNEKEARAWCEHTQQAHEVAEKEQQKIARK